MDTKNKTNGIKVIQVYDEVKIVSGPSHHDLVNAYAYAFNETNPHKARFTLDLVTKGFFTTAVLAQVIGLEYESGSEGLHNIRANFKYCGREVQATGFYNAKQHIGYFRIPRSK